MGIMDNEGHDPTGFGNLRPVEGSAAYFEMRDKIAATREHQFALARAEIERLRRQPSSEVIEAAVRAMAHINEDATGLKFSDLLRRMAVAAIGVYRSNNEQSGDAK